MTFDPARLPRYSAAGGSLSHSNTATAPRARTSSGPAPSPVTRRLELLDALRGFALLGVLLVNLRSFSLYEFITQPQRGALPTAAWDRAMALAMELLVDAKSITLFTLLFGIGFAMQTSRPASNAGGTRLHVRRMLVLLAIGLVHAYLFWWGDILRYYAVFGLLLLAFTTLRTRTLAVLGVCVAVVLPVLLQPVLPGLLPQQLTRPQASAAAWTAFVSGDWTTMLQGNLTRDIRMRIAVWSLPLFVFGRLLIGMAIGRTRVLQESVAHRRFWLRLLGASLGVSVAASLLLALRDHDGTGVVAAMLHDGSGLVATRLLREIAPLAQGLFYMAGFVLLFQHAGWRRWAAWR